MSRPCPILLDASDPEQRATYWHEMYLREICEISYLQNKAYCRGRADEREVWGIRLQPLLKELYESEALSEQQCAAYLGTDLIGWRFWPDRQLTDISERQMQDQEQPDDDKDGDYYSEEAADIAESRARNAGRDSRRLEG